MSPEKKEIKFTVTAAANGQRLDIYLAAKDEELSRSQVKIAIEDGLVLVNNLAPKVSQKLKTGDEIILKKIPAAVAVARPQNIPLEIVHEDAAIIVINKPAGMVVHPAPGNPDNTLVNALLFHCHDLSGIGGVLRPGIVHRLDKDTSGLLVAAKSDDAHRKLAAQFEKHLVHKIYYALVWGDIRGSHGEIIMPVGRHPSDRKKMSTKSRRGRDAITLWKAKERFGMATLLEVDIRTGRTHQIRVHLADRGYPVIGDKVYSHFPHNLKIAAAALKEQLRLQQRQALHAASLSFLHPVNGERVVFTAALPDDMSKLCSALRANES
ncbi:MAG TPA: RluA family pseudouridine synthase [Smithellaceae bacterium]|nr:RluA family pseudouridine synthase [Smithellaceae bacterium]